MRERLRKIYNRIVYAISRGLFFWSSDVEFFPDANGWSFTFRHKMLVYKYCNLSFLFHPSGTFTKFVSFHKDVATRKIIEYVPPFRTSRFYVAYEYIPHAQNLIQSLFAEPVLERRKEMLSKVFVMVDRFHSEHIIHGDLKPKNILVTPEGQLYVIDFENAFISDSINDRVVDYQKFIPRLIYLFTADEVRWALAEASASQSLVAYTEKYFVAFNPREIIEMIEGVRFEHTGNITGEDIDVTVPNVTHIAVLSKHIEAAGLDCRLFFRSRNDVKMFVYNLSGVTELDMHLGQSLSRFVFLWEKTRKHPSVQIAVTGPDGVGKTTLLEGIQKQCRDELLAQFPKRVIHAWRFAREGWTPPVGRWTLQDRVAARWRESLLGLRVAYERLLRRNTFPLILLDRSFYDPYIQGSALKFRLWPLWRVVFPPNVWTILLQATPTTIAIRKSELSATGIERYYQRAAKRLPIVAAVDVEKGGEEAQERLERLIRFFIFTRTYFLP